MRKCSSGFTHGLPIILLINYLSSSFNIGFLVYRPKSHLPNQSFFSVGTVTFETFFGPSMMFPIPEALWLIASELWDLQAFGELVGTAHVPSSAMGLLLRVCLSVYFCHRWRTATLPHHVKEKTQVTCQQYILLPVMLFFLLALLSWALQVGSMALETWGRRTEKLQIMEVSVWQLLETTRYEATQLELWNAGALLSSWVHFIISP